MAGYTYHKISVFVAKASQELRNARNNPGSEYLQSPQLEEGAGKSKQDSHYPDNYRKIYPKFHKKHPVAVNEVSDEKPYDKNDRVNGKTKFFYLFICSVNRNPPEWNDRPEYDDKESECIRYSHYIIRCVPLATNCRLTFGTIPRPPFPPRVRKRYCIWE